MATTPTPTPTPNHEFDVERLRKMTDSMITAITHPEFVDAMRKIHGTPIEDRLSMGAKLLDPEALRAAGVPLPLDMRITSRYFEPGNPGVIEIGDHNPPINTAGSGGITLPSGTYQNPLAPNKISGIANAGGCACGGGLTFCGGAGGNT